MELDEALERFHKTGLEYGGGLANHGPMAAEALVRLGHPALVPHFVQRYAPRLPALEVGSPMDPAERAAALGRAERLPDWVATFERELAEQPWREVLAAALPGLLPGLFAGAAHGLLRVAHAVRALEDEETSARVRELGQGLAYWAGRFQRLPGLVGSDPRPGFGFGRVLAEVKPVPQERRRPGLFFEAVKVLDGDAGFEAALASLSPTTDEQRDPLGTLALAGARLYLSQPGARIAYVHAVTAPSALRVLMPHLQSADRESALGAALQATAALHAVSAGAPRAGPEPEIERLAGDPAEIRYRAACSLEEHAIKFSEACLREDAIAPDPLWRLAAADAAAHLESAERGVC